MDSSGRPRERRARTPRPPLRSHAGDLGGDGEGAQRRFRFPGSADRQAAVRQDPCGGAPADELPRHGPRLSIVVPRLGRRADAFPREVAEAALAHVVGDETERAYRRGDALEKRRELMSAWAAFCDASGGNVVAFPARA